MSIAVWPSDLPKPTRDGYQSQINDPRLKKSRDTGPIGWRRRTSSVSRSVALTIQVDRELKAVFDQFYTEISGVGSLPFWMPDPVTDGWALLDPNGAPFLSSDGAPLLTPRQLLCLWGEETPQERIIGTEFTISFSVMVMP